MIIAYADCFSGISGDMFLGALIDAGVPLEFIRQELATLGIGNFKITTRKADTSSIGALKVDVAGETEQPYRTWKDIRKLFDGGKVPEKYGNKAKEVFAALAEAEAKIHGCAVEEVHFHEVGAIDAIVDIVGTIIGLEYLNVGHLVCSPIPMPRGWVSCSHGMLPVPAPAVCELLKDVPVYGVEIEQELVTPTGAALIKTLAAEFGPFPSMTVIGVGYGAGSRERSDGRPNTMRLVTGRKEEIAEEQEVEVIETHIDDWSPEGYPYLSELLYNQGALDVVAAPLQMKKGRPGFLLRVVSGLDRSWELKRIILSETSAIGLRYRRENRWTLPREHGLVQTPLGPVRVKKIATPAGDVLSPEYEDCRRLAAEQSVPIRQIYQAVSACTPDDFRKS